MNNVKYITLDQLMASVKDDFSSFSEKDLINDTGVIKTAMLCNEKLGIPIRRIVEKCIKIENHKGELPKNFNKIIFIAGLSKSYNKYTIIDPFDNTRDLTENPIPYITYQEGCTTKCRPIITKKYKEVEIQNTEWFDININNASSCCSSESPHFRHNRNGISINIEEGVIHTPFKDGELYLMYYSLMEDEDGNVLVPFHPLITNWYEWSIKEKILQDIMFNSNDDVANKLKYATEQRKLHWLDAINYEMEPEYKELRNTQRKLEMDYYNKYFKYLLY